MAVREPKDLLTMLADRGEEAIQRLSDAPGADRVLGAAQALRDRLDEIQKRLRGLHAIQRRVAALGKRVDSPSGAKSRSTSTRNPASSSKSGARAKPKSS